MFVIYNEDETYEVYSRHIYSFIYSELNLLLTSAGVLWRTFMILFLEIRLMGVQIRGITP